GRQGHGEVHDSRSPRRSRRSEGSDEGPPREGRRQGLGRSSRRQEKLHASDDREGCKARNESEADSRSRRRSQEESEALNHQRSNRGASQAPTPPIPRCGSTMCQVRRWIGWLLAHENCKANAPSEAQTSPITAPVRASLTGAPFRSLYKVIAAGGRLIKST